MSLNVSDLAVSLAARVIVEPDAPENVIAVEPDGLTPLLQFARCRRNERMTQQALRRENKKGQGIPLEQRRLTTQRVKVLRRCCAIDETKVDVRR